MLAVLDVAHRDQVRAHAGGNELRAEAKAHEGDRRSGEQKRHLDHHELGGAQLEVGSSQVLREAQAAAQPLTPAGTIRQRLERRVDPVAQRCRLPAPHAGGASVLA